MDWYTSCSGLCFAHYMPGDIDIVEFEKGKSKVFKTQQANKAKASHSGKALLLYETAFCLQLVKSSPPPF